MMRGATMLLALIAIACRSTNGHNEPKPASDSGATHKPPPAATPTKAAMEITYRDLPDDSWKRAAEVVVAAARELLAQTNSAHVVVRPYASPDGEIVPYLLFVETTSADGAPAFRGSAAVWNGKLVNGGGATATTGFLAAAGFPAKQVSLGHLLELLYITGAIDLSWFSPPSAIGWDGVTRPFYGTDLARALDYTKTGAVLHLYRGVGTGPASTAPPAGRGVTMPELERLDVTFDAKARFTTAILRQNPTKTAWHVIR
jgi:hypothetical protein